MTTNRLFELYRNLCQTDLVANKTVDDNTMLTFQTLLNQATPIDAVESAQRDLVRKMYYLNPVNFSNYLRDSANKARSLVLWTESKLIAQFLRLNGLVHISWVEESTSYRVVRYIRREDRPDQKETGKPATKPVSKKSSKPASKTAADVVDEYTAAAESQTSDLRTVMEQYQANQTEKNKWSDDTADV